METRIFRFKLQVFDMQYTPILYIYTCLTICFNRFSEVTSQFLDQIRSFRYNHAIPPEDEGKFDIPHSNVPCRDLFAYGQLVKETIGKCVESQVSNASEFAELAGKQLQSANAPARGTAIALSAHKFFDQPLLCAQDFLSQISIKSSAAKEEFFKYDAKYHTYHHSSMMTVP